MMEYYAGLFGEYPFLTEKYAIAEFTHSGRHGAPDRDEHGLGLGHRGPTRTTTSSRTSSPTPGSAT